MRRNRTIEEALTKLYQLLEQYAPSWYTQEHREMTERALALFQGYQHAPRKNHGIYEFGDLRVDVRRMEVSLNGQPVFLAAREFQLLRYLVERRGIAISRTELLQAVWGYAAQSSTRTVDVHVRQLRRKLGDASTIVTVWGVGYKVSPAKSPTPS